MTNKNQFDFKEYIVHLFDLSKDTNHENTISTINSGIGIKGSNVWVLIFSILLASIGLNVSSTAVVIGAMLISPLMGPILGLGMSIAINDIDMLKKSIINLGIMVIISLVTSFLFFSIPLFQDETSELLARTKPDLRDVLIALAGGLALIVSITRKNDMTNTIAGVAIATALMPPLCTAGYGLAIGNINYFGGAFFLFIINSTFIALATFLILKSLNFSTIHYDYSKTKTNVARIASLVALLVLLGSVYTFWNLIQEKQFIQKVHKLNTMVVSEGFNLIDQTDNYDYKKQQIILTIFGKTAQKNDSLRWKNELNKLGLVNSGLIIRQNNDDANILKQVKEIKSTYQTQLNLLNDKDRKIALLERQVEFQTIPIKEIGDEAKINYTELRSISFAKRLVYNFQEVDTMTVVITKWDNNSNELQFERFKTWLKMRLKNDKIQVIKE